MKNHVAGSVLAVMMLSALAPADGLAVVRTRLTVSVGHPIHRALPRTVIVRPARHHVVVTAHPVYLAPVAFVPAVVALPGPKRLVWQDTEVIHRNEDWVDTNYGIDATGNALYLRLNGKAQLNFAEVTFSNGEVQVVDFAEHVREPGTYRLLDFRDGRKVDTVRILAKSVSKDARMTVYMAK